MGTASNGTQASLAQCPHLPPLCFQMRDMSVTSPFLIQPSSCSLFLCLAAVDTGAWCMPTGTQTYTHSLTHLALLPAPTQACVPRPSTAYSFQHCSYTHTLSLTSPTHTRTCFFPLLSQISPLLSPKSRALDWLQSTRRKGWDFHITLKWEEAPDLIKRILRGFIYC